MTDKSLLRNLQTWKEDTPKGSKYLTAGETPQFDDNFVSRKINSNIEILNELREAIESYDDPKILESQQSVPAYERVQESLPDYGQE